ncbi:DUF3893 domain-containing protein [Hahella sp. KA22]|uniref:RNaseH domain-containing protein n=1 Tax=Hahella sp. KA22 TaxID=1628392 RepID=UPI000FDEED3D|nr:RNaseH domain-containing protein [Hahella sp. KA22]AZZ95340.1 DUF3893 domain-containing protein [Hahella sp. KA22]QAY52985.1 DUF3893 domain-containing protein [Hahella sp. KA22]
MSKAILHPYFYEFDLQSCPDTRLVRYAMPARIYNAIRQAQGHSDKYNADLGGLAAVLGWVAPVVDLCTVDWPVYGQPKTLCLTCIAPGKELSEIRKEVEAALRLWISFILPSQAPQINNLFMDGRVSSQDAWTERPIDDFLYSNYFCAYPKDLRAYDLLTLIAARALEGKAINTGNPDEGTLVSSGPRDTLYSGKSLLRYEVTPVDSRRSSGWWTELFTVSAATTPESKNIRVSVNISTRNYGSLTKYDLKKVRSRYLDIFLPADANLTSNSTRMRCIELEVSRRDWWYDQKDNVEELSQSRRVLKSILEFSGLQCTADRLGLEAIFGSNLAILPRLGSVHGDDQLPAGTGVSHPERGNHLVFLDEHLASAGFRRIDMQRTVRAKPKTKLSVLNRDASELRQAIMLTLGKEDRGVSTLAIRHFQSRPEGQNLLHSTLESLLGHPDEIVDGVWTYTDGLNIDIRSLTSGPLAQRTDNIDKTKLPEKVAYPLLMKAKESLLQTKWDEATIKMVKHAGSAKPTSHSPWAAFVEMNSALLDEPERDPYLLAYAALAREGAVAQTRLFDPAVDSKIDFTDPDDKQNIAERCAYENSVLDLLRALGVSPVKDDAIRLAAWYVINRNAGVSANQAGRKSGILTPLYIQSQSGKLSVALMNEQEQISWCTYPEALMRITQGKVANLQFNKGNERTIKIERFYAEATPRDQFPTILFAEATNIRRFVKSFGNNEKLRTDRLELGSIGDAEPQRVLTPNDNISVVRITDEPVKSPCYWVEHNKQGITSGVFHEQRTERTFWLTRGLPKPLQMSSAVRSSNQKSRHETGAHQFKHRRFPSLNEIVVMMKSEQFDALDLVSLARQAMRAHIATDDMTILPFPLHEAYLLSKAAE